MNAIQQLNCTASCSGNSKVDWFDRSLIEDDPQPAFEKHGAALVAEAAPTKAARGGSNAGPQQNRDDTLPSGPPDMVYIVISTRELTKQNDDDSVN